MVFLLLNGYCARVHADDAARFLIDQVILGRAAKGAIARWLERQMQAVPG